MAFDGLTNLLRRPQGLRDLLAPRLPQNTNGFQRAHNCDLVSQYNFNEDHNEGVLC